MGWMDQEKLALLESTSFKMFTYDPCNIFHNYVFHKEQVEFSNETMTPAYKLIFCIGRNESH